MVSSSQQTRFCSTSLAPATTTETAAMEAATMEAMPTTAKTAAPTHVSALACHACAVAITEATKGS
jgi:hypothetical protein